MYDSLLRFFVYVAQDVITKQVEMPHYFKHFEKFNVASRIWTNNSVTYQI